jgi:hypothetical protein
MRCLWRRCTIFVQKVVEAGRVCETSQQLVVLVRLIGLERVKQIVHHGSTRSRLRSICSCPGDLPFADRQYFGRTMIMIVGGHEMHREELVVIQETLVNIN